MSQRPLNTDVKVTRVMNAVAAGTTDQNGTGVDMTGFDGVVFIGAVGTLTATQVTQMHAESSANNSDWSDITGSQTTAMADTDSNKLIVLDMFQPPQRYVRPVLERGTANAVIDGIVAIQYRAKAPPTTHATSVQTSKIVKQGVVGTL